MARRSLIPGSAVVQPDHEHADRGVLDAELGPSAAGVLEGVSRDLGDCGRESALILGIETQHVGDLARTAACDHDVPLMGQINGDNGLHDIWT